MKRYNPLNGQQISANENEPHYKLPRNILVKKPIYMCCVICETNNLNYVPTFKQEFACVQHYIEKNIPSIMINNDISFQKTLKKRYVLGLKLNKFYQELEHNNDDFNTNFSKSSGWRTVDTLAFSISNIDFELSEFINKFIKEEKARKLKNGHFPSNFKYISNFSTVNIHNSGDILCIPKVFEHITLGGILRKDDMKQLYKFMENKLFIQHNITPHYIEDKQKRTKIIKYVMDDYFDIVQTISQWLFMNNNKKKIIYNYQVL